MPNIPCAENVFKSAWIPAPPLQSEPAIDSAFFMAVSPLLDF